MELANLFKYIASFIGAFFIADVLTRYILKRCLERHLVDSPNERKLHTAAVPRLGGIAVFAAFQLVSLYLVLSFGYLAVKTELTPLWWFYFLPPAALLLVIGVVDDLYELSPLVKLTGQIAAASLLISFGTSIGNISFIQLSPVADYILTLFWFLLVINAFNLIDGLDGLAGGLAAIAAIGLFGIFVISHEVFASLLMLAFVGSVCGFLRHNFHPAKIFLGDSGSMFLGFSLAAFSLCSPSKGSTITTLAACVLAIGVPLLDTMLAVWRRSLRQVFSDGSGVMKADMDHIHHRLIKRGLNQRRVALTLYAFSAFLVAVGLLSLLFSSYAHGIYLIAFTFGTYIIFRHLANVELWDSGTAIVRGISRPSASMITTILYPVADVAVMSVALFLTVELVATIEGWAEFRRLYLSLLPIWVGTCFLAVGLAGTYKRVWSRARVSEFVYLIGAFSFGTMLSAGLSSFLEVRSHIPDLILFTTLYFGLSGGLLCGLRAIPRVVIDLLFVNSDIGASTQEQQRRILVVGADVLYLRHLKDFDWSSADAVPFRVVGLVDADRNLRRRIVHGYKVLGTPEELAKIVSQFDIDEIVVTGEAQGVSKEALIRLGQQHGIAVKEWGVRESVLTQPTSHSKLQPEKIQEVSEEEITQIIIEGGNQEQRRL